jgi:hypothetical protein
MAAPDKQPVPLPIPSPSQPWPSRRANAAPTGPIRNWRAGILKRRSPLRFGLDRSLVYAT